MSDDKVKEVIDYLPNASQIFPVQDEKFLFFFEPKLMDVNRFLFCLTVKTGTQVFSAIMLIQALSSFFIRTVELPISFSEQMKQSEGYVSEIFFI